MNAYKHYRYVTRAQDQDVKEILIDGGSAGDINVLLGETTIINGGGASGIGE